MKKLMILGVALLLVSSVLIAQPAGMKAAMQKHPMMMKQHDCMDKGMGGNKEMGMGMNMECMEAMELTPAQQKKFAELRTSFMKIKNTLSAEIENLKIDMRTYMKSENFSKAKELNKTIFTKQNSLADARIDMMAAIVKELTPAQKETMKKNMTQNMGRKHQMQGGMGMKGGMGMGRNMDNCQDCDTDKGK